MQPVVIELLGGESTGKSTLAARLSETARAHGIENRLVPEYLRDWVLAQGRMPAVHEQVDIAAAQEHAIREAITSLLTARWASHDAYGLVFADTSALQTAAYSTHYFADNSLWPTALGSSVSNVQHIRLLMGLDLPWVSEPRQRDGRAARNAVDACLRDHLQTHAMPFQVIYGKGHARTQAAWVAIANLLARDAWLSPQPATQRRTDWICQDCSDPDCERRLFTGRVVRNGASSDHGNAGRLK